MSSSTTASRSHGRRAAHRRSTWRPGPVPETVTLSRPALLVGGLSVVVITISGWASFLITSTGR